jgi:hypothetical protein
LGLVEGKAEEAMNRFHVFGVALLALLAFGVLTAVSASAAAPVFLLAEWLVGGVAVAAELETKTTGELTLKDSGLKSAVLCSMIVDGWVGPNSLGSISEVLTLAGGLTSAPLGSVPIICAVVEGCSTTAAAPEAWAVNLPWETELELMEQNGEIFFAGLITSPNGTKTVGWSVQCTILGIKSEDECTAATGVTEFTEEGANIVASFSPAFNALAEVKLPNCTLGGNERGEVTGSGIVTLVAGGELDGSSGA